MRNILSNYNSNSQNKFKIVLVLSLVFLIESLIFRQFFEVFSVIGVRPSALPVVFGLMFGFYGAIGAVLGNLIANILSGYTPLLITIGAISKFIYAILPFIMWNAIDEIQKCKLQDVRLDSGRSLFKYIVIIFLNGLVISVFLGYIMRNLGARTLFPISTLMLLLNNLVLCMIVGIPLIIFISLKKLSKKHADLSLNEKLVLMFLVFGVISSVLFGSFVFAELYQTILNSVTIWMLLYFYISVNLLCFYILSIAFIRYFEKNITLPIASIANIAGNFINDGKNRNDSEVIIKKCERLASNKAEVGVLANAFKTMVLDIDSYIHDLTIATAENERIATELNIATKLQADMLPSIFPAFPDRSEFEIYATMQPAREVGGDFYDFFMVDENHLGMVIADVSGKGIPAALFMVIAKTLISNWARNGDEAKDVFSKVNNSLCEGNENAMFVTAWLGILNIETGLVTCVNAGHEPPLIKKASGAFEFIKNERNPMLGMMENVHYKQSIFEMKKDDMLYLYTDGVTDAHSETEELYGKSRLENELNSMADIDISKILLNVKENIDKFAGIKPQFDDITMLILKMRK